MWVNLLDRSLGGVVDRVAGQHEPGGRAGDGDDPPVVGEVFPGELQAVEHALDVDGEACVEFGLGDLGERLGDRDRGVVHQDVPAAVLGSSRSAIAWYSARLVMSAATAIAVPAAVSMPATILSAGSGVWLWFTTTRGGGERGGDGLADPGGRPGHQGGLALQGCRGVAHDPPPRGSRASAGYRNGRAARVSSGITAYCVTGMTIRTKTRGRAPTGSGDSRGATQ